MPILSTIQRDLRHFVSLLTSVVECKLRQCTSLTVHLPFELQHREAAKLFGTTYAYRLLYIGELLKKLFRIKLYWENAPWLNVTTWDLKYGNTIWGSYLYDLEICLDTGHLMLGCSNKKQFEGRLTSVFKLYGKQIRHLHLSENDFNHDQHNHTRRILTKTILDKITKGRTYIWEK